MDAKEVAARQAVSYVRDGMTLGLGTGSTAAFALRALGERIKREGLRVRGVPTSLKSREIAEEVGIPRTDFAEALEIDLTIDGADEVDPEKSIIKGGGGALVREKIVARASREVIIICDESKMCAQLGRFPLPVAVFPFGWQATQRRLAGFGAQVTLRLQADGSPLFTDDGLSILDVHCECIPDPAALERRIKAEVGVAEVGLFVGLATRIVVGYADGRVEIRE